MTDYPVIFTLRDPVAGRGYWAGVTLCGRAVMCQEDGEWWIYGVQPGAIAESGTTPGDAFFNFRNRYKGVLFDFAEEAKSFQDFEREVKRFFGQSDTEEALRWKTAFQAIRSGAVKPEDEFFAKLPKEAPEAKEPSVSVELIDLAKARPEQNVQDCFALAPAA